MKHGFIKDIREEKCSSYKMTVTGYMPGGLVRVLRGPSSSTFFSFFAYALTFQMLRNND